VISEQEVPGNRKLEGRRTWIVRLTGLFRAIEIERLEDEKSYEIDIWPHWLHRGMDFETDIEVLGDS
jgi:hypothetical protein